MMLDQILQKRILIIEDSPEHQAVIRESLGRSPQHIYVESLEKAREEYRRTTFDLILLDLLLPDGHGFEFCSEFSQDNSCKRPAIIVLSSRTEASDKVLSFSMGAADYVTKPFNPLELQARILSRIKFSEKLNSSNDSSSNSSNNEVHCGNLFFNELKYQATIEIEGQPTPERISLSFFEAKLLRYFLNHIDQVLTRQGLLDDVWGTENHVLDRSVDSAVSGLRKKLASWNHSIKSVYGAGYRISRNRAA